jgi:LacI family transcriptional regulator
LPTINDVARRAEVSPVTVSRVINKARNVSPATRERVEQAIQELGYVPSAAARSLRSKRTRTMALVVPDITNAFWTTVARGVEDAAQSCGYSVLLYNTDETPGKQLRYLDVIASQRVDGVIIAPYDSDARNLATLRARNIPIVVIDRRIQGWEVDTVCGDSVSGARALVRHLIDLGHQRIAMISGPLNTSTAEDRVSGYCLALSEAGIPVSPSLIKRGEYHAPSGERLTYQLLDEDLNPTAIFAANNAIAMGVIDALEKRGLRIPQDVALVCFDDLPNASRFFPFLTVAVQPAYDMGLNAAQLLLSRLDDEVSWPARHVVLPTRLIIRYSCGRPPLKENGYAPRLPDLKEVQIHSVLVKPLSADQVQGFGDCIPGAVVPSAWHETRPSSYQKSDVGRLLRVLRHQEADRVPYLEFSVAGRSAYEYVLERRVDYRTPDDHQPDRQPVSPEDHVEFAQRLGMDAVSCEFFWQPNNLPEKSGNGSQRYPAGKVGAWPDVDDLEPPPALAGQLSHLERYLRAAQGTGVGVVASFSSFFDSALRATGIGGALPMLPDDQPFLEKVMDAILEHQEKVVRAVCDRFADELALVLINDDIAHAAGVTLPLDLFVDIFSGRMHRLILPAQEHNLLLGMHSDGRMDQLLPILHEMGFAAVHPLHPDTNDIFRLRREWAGKLALIGNVPASLLAYADESEIEATVREYCARLGPGGGYVLSSAGKITDAIPPGNLVTMVHALHKYGLYGSLGQES